MGRRRHAANVAFFDVLKHRHFPRLFFPAGFLMYDQPEAFNRARSTNSA